jgi:hypothetical protein
MTDNVEIFDTKYVIKSKTTIEKELIEEKAKAELKIEDEKYGISKPIRVIIKAKVSHGEN